MLYDVHWTPAIIIELANKKTSSPRVGLADGRTLPLTVRVGKAQRALKLYDVVYVKVIDGANKGAARAELRVPPVVQGAALVLENKTGKILAMTGGFSYPLSQLNRTTQAQRQPGSAIKPLTYLAALQAGLQPNALVPDEPITLPPIGGGAHATEKDYWSPKNYEGGSMGILTLRRALENSRNLVTARLLDGGIDKDPAVSLKRVCDIALEAKVYPECIPYYPFVLGAQPVRPIDLAGFYATVANEGARPAPYALESIEQNGRTIYQHQAEAPVQLKSADRVAFYQLKTMLAGVVERGTAASARDLAPYVAGKTGTSEEENDTWFAGFTNDITIVVWVGYDNADGTHRTLGTWQYRSECRVADLPVDHPRGLDERGPEGRACPAVGRGEAADRRFADRPQQWRPVAAWRPQHVRRAFPLGHQGRTGGAHEPSGRTSGRGRQKRLARKKVRTAARRPPVQNVAAQCFFFFCNSGWQYR